MKNQDQDQKMKQFVENLVQQLQSKGMKVTSAALLRLGDNEGKPSQLPPAPGQVDMNRVQDVLGKLAAGGIRLPNPISTNKTESTTEQTKEKCFCPDCFNFNTFEEVLTEQGSTFDYTTITLNGQQFDVKYHQSPSGDERIMIQKVQRIGLEKLNMDELQLELSEAVQKKEFANAQQILNEIQARKNKN